MPFRPWRMEVGRTVAVRNGPRCPVKIVAVVPYANFPVTVEFPDGKRGNYTFRELTPLCASCGHAYKAHAQGTGKCLFGAGEWA